MSSVFEECASGSKCRELPCIDQLVAWGGQLYSIIRTLLCGQKKYSMNEASTLGDSSNLETLNYRFQTQYVLQQGHILISLVLEHRHIIKAQRGHKSLN